MWCALCSWYLKNVANLQAYIVLEMPEVRWHFFIVYFSADIRSNMFDIRQACISRNIGKVIASFFFGFDNFLIFKTEFTNPTAYCAMIVLTSSCLGFGRQYVFARCVMIGVKIVFDMIAFKSQVACCNLNCLIFSFISVIFRFQISVTAVGGAITMFRGSIYCGRQFISHSLFLFEIGVVVMAEVFLCLISGPRLCENLLRWIL